MSPGGRLQDEVRSLRWAVQSARAIRRQVHVTRIDTVEVPGLPAGLGRDVRVMWLYLRFGVRNCLVNSLVRQAWYRGQGQPRELVIGVRAPGPDFCAHAWLEGDPETASEGFEELARFPAR